MFQGVRGQRIGDSTDCAADIAFKGPDLMQHENQIARLAVIGWQLRAKRFSLILDAFSGCGDAEVHLALRKGHRALSSGIGV